MGLAHPLASLRGRGLDVLRAEGVDVELLEASEAVTPGLIGAKDEATWSSDGAAVRACAEVNEALMHREAREKPFSVLKYAMTLDGKIATSAWHSAWISSVLSREQVYRERALSDAVVVGGNTVRRDNPHLTTHDKDSAYAPTRVVLSRSLDMPRDANLWDIEDAPTIVFTERGSDKSMQSHLARRGVQVTELEKVTPEAVARECHQLGMVRLFWECGGTLAAPAISSGVISKVMAFVAPKVIGGSDAPGPVGDLGLTKMTEAIELVEPSFRSVGPDILVSGHLPSSGGLSKLVRDCALERPRRHGTPRGTLLRSRRVVSPPSNLVSGSVVNFYKAWDSNGVLSNFYPSELNLSLCCGGDPRIWGSVEHFYQAHKFCPRGGPCCPGADSKPRSEDEKALGQRRHELVERIFRAETPEKAARVGRWAERIKPELLQPGWDKVKLTVMEKAVREKFRLGTSAAAVLLGTGEATIQEASPRDAFWGIGASGRGRNHLGLLLMEQRARLRAEEALSGLATAPADVPKFD